MGPSCSLCSFAPAKALCRTDMSSGRLQSIGQGGLFLSLLFAGQWSSFSSWPCSSIFCGFDCSTCICLCCSCTLTLSPRNGLWQDSCCKYGVLLHFCVFPNLFVTSWVVVCLPTLILPTRCWQETRMLCLSFPSVNDPHASYFSVFSVKLPPLDGLLKTRKAL